MQKVVHAVIDGDNDEVVIRLFKPNGPKIGMDKEVVFEKATVEDFLTKLTKEMPVYFLQMYGGDTDLRPFIRKNICLIEDVAIAIMVAAYQKRNEVNEAGCYDSDGRTLAPDARQLITVIAKTVAQYAIACELDNHDKAALYSFFCEYFNGAVEVWIDGYFVKHSFYLNVASPLIRKELVDDFWHVMTASILFFTYGKHHVLSKLERFRIDEARAWNR